ncbi:MAG: alanine racemase [Aridibacter sp.]
MTHELVRRPTYARINLDDLAFNFKSVKDFVGQNIEYMAVVKADGYGHGSIDCAKKLESAGIDWFGVALPEEGLELRKAGITKPILCLGSFWEGQEKLLLKNGLTPVIFQIEKAYLYNRVASELNQKADVHIKIDTGMGRIGIRLEEVKVFVQELKKYKNLNIEGIMTHFAAADDLSENDFTQSQIKRFNEAVKLFEQNGFNPKYKDLANSPGAIVQPDSLGNMVRLGGILYGLGEDVLPKEVEKPILKPILSLHTKIAYLKKVPANESIGYGRTFMTKRESLIATIPIGYQDGFHRKLSNCGQVIINDTFAPIVGRISMDWTMLDVTDVPNVKVDDEVILIGRQNEKKISAADIAKKLDTISYEITCGISRRVPRKYVGSE